MARDTAAIGEDVVINTNTPDVETTVEALIRAYNRQPLDSDLGEGDLIAWDNTAGAWTKIDVSAASEGDVLTVQADGTVAPESATYSESPLFTPDGGSEYFGVPGGAMIGNRASSSLGAGNYYYGPIRVFDTITVTAMAVEVVTAAGAGDVARLGIYNVSDPNTLVPGSLVSQAGDADISATGVQPVTGLSITLKPGLYLGVIHPEANVTVRHVEDASVSSVVTPTDFAQMPYQYRALDSFGALSDPGPAIGSPQATTNGVFRRMLYYQWD